MAQMLAPPENITVSQGIARSLVTSTGPYEPGLTPYMAEPADKLDSRRYSTVVCLGPARTGKTVTLIDGWVARNVVHAPGDMLIVQASQDLARYYSKVRLDRMIAASPDVRSRISPRRQDDNTYDKVFRSGMVLSIGWPSGAQLSGRDFRYVAVTEYDLAEDDIDGEGSLYVLAQMRTTTFLSAGKTLVESSVRREYRDAQWRAPDGSPHMAPPATGITGLYNSGTRCWFYWRCPDCREWMALNPDIHEMFQIAPLEQLVEDLAGKDATKWAADHASIACRHCGSVIKEASKRDLNKGGVWVPDGCKVVGDGQIIGAPRSTDIASYQISSVAAAYQSWPKLLEKYAVAIQAYARTGDEVDIKSTVNLDQGRAYLPLAIRKARSNSELQDRATGDWIQGTVPHGVRFMTCAIDVQAGKRAGFVVQVHGWGVGLEKWIVDRFTLFHSERPDGKGGFLQLDPASYAEDWNRLIEKCISRRYALADGSGRSMPIRMTVCDSGGAAAKDGDGGVTQRAYDFVRLLRTKAMSHKFRLVKGADRPNAKRVEKTTPEKRSDRNSGAAGDVPVLILNTTQLKDVVMADVWRTSPGPGFYHFPRWCGESFFNEMTAETRGEKRWESTGRPNETLDLCVYNQAAVIELGADRFNWQSPPNWAETWDRNPDVHVDNEPLPPVPIQRRPSTYLSNRR